MLKMHMDERNFGRRFRMAVEMLLGQAASIEDPDLAPEHLFRACIRMAMRMVTIMFAEARGLLPLENEVYRNNYSLATAGDRLEQAEERAPEQLAGRYHEWPAVCALFRLVYEGSAHEAMPLRAYGSDLFAPGNPAGDGARKALALLEEGGCTPDDRCMAGMLSLLQASTGGLAFYRKMDIRTMGSLYENLLDFGACRVQNDQPLVELAISQRPLVAVARLEKLSDQALVRLMTSAGLEAADVDLNDASPPDGAVSPEQRVDRFRRRLGALGFENGVKEAFLPGQLYLANDNSGRKEGGVYYTPVAITLPMVVRVLEPLCRTDEGTLKTPDQLLSLTVCDPAMGSGAFLVGALSYLTSQVVKALRIHGCLEVLDKLDLTVVHLDNQVSFELPGTPGDEAFEMALEGHVKRHVVERCIHGVDVDPLTVELARMSLWLETMDSRLPFTFLNHKLKQGNSLVGAWYDDLRRYPMEAWARFDQCRRKTAQAANRVKSQARTLEQGRTSGVLPFAAAKKEVGATHRKLARAMEKIHRVPIEFPDRKADLYQAQVLDRPEGRQLKQLLDSWCALWFMPPDAADRAPGPMDCAEGRTLAPEVVNEVRRQEGFFHWQLEFPEVFSPSRGGFDAVVGNPPWEVLKCDADGILRKEDGLFGCYPASVRRKLKAGLERGQEGNAAVFQALVERHGAQSHWFSAVGTGWRPYIRQGSGDFNTYKLFAEQCHALCREQGRIGLVVPSGFYSDHGAGRLRELFLRECRLEWIFGFENRRRIFNIDGRQKFCLVLAQKGAVSDEVQTAFLQTGADAFETAESRAVPYPVSLLRTLSPREGAFLEVGSREELSILSGMLEAGTPLGDLSPASLRYVREFDMSNSKGLMVPVARLERQGFERSSADLWEKDGELALPVYQGAMFQQFEPCAGASPGRIEPRFLMRARDFAANPSAVLDYKVVVRRIARNSDRRTLIACPIPPLPCGDKAAVLAFDDPVRALAVCAVLNSFAADFFARRICSGTNFDRHHLFRMPVPPTDDRTTRWLAAMSLELSARHPLFDPLWGKLGWHKPAAPDKPDRLRRHRIELRSLLDAMIAHLFHLSNAQMEEILKDCHHPVERLKDKSLRSGLDPRGFWRQDADLEPRLRLPARTMHWFGVARREGPDALVDLIPTATIPTTTSPCIEDRDGLVRRLEALRDETKPPLLVLAGAAHQSRVK